MTDERTEALQDATERAFMQAIRAAMNAAAKDTGKSIMDARYAFAAATKCLFLEEVFAAAKDAVKSIPDSSGYGRFYGEAYEVAYKKAYHTVYDLIISAFSNSGEHYD